jgi:dCMP deaminase
LHIKSGTQIEKCRAIHAEQNALLQAGKHAAGGALYVNAMSCKTCAKMIINAKIKKFVYRGFYADKEGIQILKKAGVKVIALKG